MKLPSPGFLLNAIAAVCRRFPVVVLCAALGAAACLLLINHANDPLFTRLWMVCQLGLPLLLGLAALAESKWSPPQPPHAGGSGAISYDGKEAGSVPPQSGLRHWLLQGLGVAALAAYFFVLDPGSSAFEWRTIPRFIVLLLTAHLFASLAPYLNRASVADFWEYNKRLLTHAVTGAAFTAVLFLGLSGAVLAVDQLFDLHVEYKIYARLFVLLAGLFGTVYFLFHFPARYHFEDDSDGYHIAFRNLCKYILIPIVGLYFLILYAYGIKILTTWSLPHGWVASLVIGFSVAGIFTYLLNYQLPKFDDSALVRGYGRWFWWAVLPVTVLLFVAIGRRISDYGVTEQRFLVAHAGLWLAVMCLYFLFSKTDNIKFVPLSLGLFALLCAFGPLNAFSVSERSQADILKRLLEQNGHFKNGKIAQDTSTVTTADAQRIESCLRYFEYRDHFESIRDWLPMPPDNFPDAPGGYNKTRRILHWAGIRDRGADDLPWSALIRPENTAFAAVDISGYRSYFRLESLSETDDRSSKTGRYFALDAEGSALEYCESKPGGYTVLERFEWPQALLKQWRAKATDGSYQPAPNDLRIVVTGKKHAVCIVAEEMALEDRKGKITVSVLTGGVFLK